MTDMLRLCGFDISRVSLMEAADAIAEYCCSDMRRRATQPLFVTSVNGHVLSLCARSSTVRRLFAGADIVHCDGQPLVLLSRRIGGQPLPERVATTDLFPLVAARARRLGLSFYFLGGSPDVNRAVRKVVAATYPDLRVAGASHGYLSADEEVRVVREIARLEPDVLWVAMGVPLEQSFVVRNRAALRGVGLIKTSGGLFDFVSGEIARAPVWMQRAGLEWLFRLIQEPRRLFGRYALSNPHALFLIVRGLLQNRAASRGLAAPPDAKTPRG